MRHLAGILLSVTVGLMPLTGMSQENNPDKKGADMVIVTMETTKGDITLELDRGKAPVTVANFIAYAKAGQYDGTIFHRIIPGFMIQGGGFTPGMKQKDTKPPIRSGFEILAE